MDLSFHPATADRWPDLEALFGPRGACGGCWCRWWRLPRAVYERQKGRPNKDALHALVAAGDPPGLLAYADGAPIAWCAIAPRAAYPVLERSRTLKRVDDCPVWSAPCLFVARPFRRSGVSVRVLEAATAYAAEQGAMIVEGYPVDPRTPRLPDAFAWTGTVSAFRQAGFVEALRRSDARPIMRYVVASRHATSSREP